MARAVRQIRDYHGALLLVATGLGKTVIGAETVRRVTEDYLNKQLIILAPRSVRKQWHDELDSRSLKYNYFDNNLLFRHESGGRYHQITQLLKSLESCGATTILVIDEAHRYRKVLQKDFSLRRQNQSKAETKLNLVKERIGKAARSGAKLLLLTATPYGTNRQDINSLLHLLPAPAHSISTDFTVNINHWGIKHLVSC